MLLELGLGLGLGPGRGWGWGWAWGWGQGLINSVPLTPATPGPRAEIDVCQKEMGETEISTWNARATEPEFPRADLEG